MTAIQPELWVDHAGLALSFYQAAFGATVLHRVDESDDLVAQLAVGDAAFWVASAASRLKRFSPKATGGATSRYGQPSSSSARMRRLSVILR